MREIVKIRFGSHLYGTDTPQSDTDFKGVFVPDARDILLGRVRESINANSKAPGVLKNTAEDTDYEAYSLHKFLHLCADGQTVAMDMLFASPNCLIDVTADWLYIYQERARLLSRQVRGFLGYCRQQANKYGIKGSRVAASRAMREVFGAFHSHQKVGEIYALAPEQFQGIEHVAVIQHPTRHGVTEPMIEVCNRKIPFTVTCKEAFSVVDRLFQEYGQRALAAERSEGIDWKALSHAVRVGRQALELLNTGHITFPRPEAEHLKAIKLGHLPYQPVAEEIEQLLIDVEEAAAASPLPEYPDTAWLEDFVVSIYEMEVRA